MEYKMAERDGRQLQVCYRDFRPADAPGVVACIQNEYDSTYLIPEYYKPEVLRKGAAHGKFHFLVAEADGKIVAVLGLKPNQPHDATCELIIALVLKKYRHFGIMGTLFSMALKELSAMPGISAGYAYSVTYHDFSQRSMEHLGFVPCGFLFSVLDLQKLSQSFMHDKNAKHHQNIVVIRQEKDNAGTIYIPAEHTNIARYVYDALGVKVNTESGFVPLSGKSRLVVENDAVHSSCSIRIEESGTDITDCIRSIAQKYQSPRQTFNVMLNVSDQRAVAAYHELRQLGYFFTGWQPITGKNEFMLLHNPGHVPIDFAAIAIAEDGQYLLKYVKTCYQNRGNYHG